MDGETNRRRLFAAGAVVIGGYLVAWVWALASGNYAAVIVLLRAALVTLGLGWVALAVWWWRRVKTFTVRSLVFGGPLLVGVLAVPLPYYSHGRNVQSSLQNAGVQYRVQAAGFSRTLQNVASELFALDSPNLFAAELTYVSIDLAKVRPEQLLKLDRQPKLQVVSIIKSNVDQQISQPLTEWINALPGQTQLKLWLYKVDQHDVDRVQAIQRRSQEIVITGNPSIPSALDAMLNCQPESMAIYNVDFPKEFGETLDGTIQLREVRLNSCRLSGDQLVKLAERSKCTTLNCDNLTDLTTQLSVEQCEQLAALPHLESLLLGTTRLDFDQLQPLMASPSLKSFMSAAVRAVGPEELARLRDLIPEGCNRRVRVDYGVGIAVGDVGLRRGGM